MFELFGLAPEDGTGADLPIAPVTWLADTGARPRGYWLRADPTCLQADRDRLVMIGGVPALRDDEAQTLVSAITEVLGGGAWTLHAPRPQRWYLQLDARPALLTRPLPEVVGHDTRNAFPRGADALAWQAWLTEVQMLLHAHPVNQARAATGRPAVNSLWLWGGGELPEPAPAPWTRVWAEEPLARGLAALCGVPVAPAPAGAAQWLAEAGAGAHLLVLEAARDPAQHGDAAAWSEVLRGWDRLWFGPLAGALRERRLVELTLVADSGQAYRVGARDLGRWWRMRWPLTVFR